MFRTSMDTPSRSGKATTILRASSFAESSSVAERTPIGAPHKTRRIRMARYDRLDRLMLIAVRRLTTCEAQSKLTYAGTAGNLSTDVRHQRWTNLRHCAKCIGKVGWRGRTHVRAPGSQRH